MKDAGIDEYSTELATLEEFIGFSDKNVVRIKHDYSLILNETPCVKLVKGQLESSSLTIASVWILNILNSHNLRPILLFPAPSPLCIKYFVIASYVVKATVLTILQVDAKTSTQTPFHSSLKGYLSSRSCNSQNQYQLYHNPGKYFLVT